MAGERLPRPDRAPPFSEEHERAALGSVLLVGSKWDVLKVDWNLKADAFYIPAHRVTWEAMESLAAAGRPVDVIAVVDQMKRDGTLEKAGGPMFLDGLMELTPTAEHVEFHAEQVAGYWSAAAKGVELLCEVMEERKSTVSNVEYMDRALARWDQQAEYRKNKQTPPLLGLSTGLPRIDELLNGLKKGVIVLAARQSTGKTALEGQISTHVVNMGHPVLRITQDSDIQELWDRDICRTAGVSLAKMERGWMFGNQRQQVVDSKELMKDWPMRCEDEVWKIRDVCSLIRADVAKRRKVNPLTGLPEPYLVTIDYLQLLRTGIPSVDNDRNSRMEECMTHLKRLYKELGIPIMVLSQIARDKDRLTGRGGCNWLDNRPIMEDIKDCSSIEQGAHVIGLMSKVEDLADEEGRTGKVTLVALDWAKHKNGQTGPIFTRFDRPYFRWEEFTQLQQSAVVKFLHDEKLVKVMKMKPEKLKEPVFENVGDAVARCNEMPMKGGG
jgi:replicative DNA helicase